MFGRLFLPLVVQYALDYRYLVALKLLLTAFTLTNLSETLLATPRVHIEQTVSQSIAKISNLFLSISLIQSEVSR